MRRRHRESPIATATGTAGKPVKVGSHPAGIAITPNGKTAYVASQGANTVTPISTLTNTAGRPIRVGPKPAGLGPGAVLIAITPNGKTAYAVTQTNGTVLVHQVGPNQVVPINTASNVAGKPITLPDQQWPLGIVITPNGKTI